MTLFFFSVYVESSSTCNRMTFNLGLGSTTTQRRSFRIKITQYTCSHPNLAPEGCVQYFFGSESGSVQTFNFDGGSHLAGQRHKACFR